ncbi:MAG TPA: site-specific integrase [Acidimicrobiales bacterium]|nr:site-specific integrase [Acidimicrobiales bacterium]
MNTSWDLDTFLGAGLSPRTAYLYARMACRLEQLLAERDTDIASCRAADVAAVAAQLGTSYSIRNRVRSTLVKCWEILDRYDGPVRAVRIPPKPRARCRALEPDQATLLEQAAWARDDDPGLATLIGLYAGLRRVEISRLRWEDIECDATGTPRWMRVHGKADLVADVPVHPVLARALARRRRPAGWVFPGKHHGTSVKPATIWAWVRLVAADAGLEVPTHVLRHTMLAEANDRSGDLRTVQEIARHSRPETTAGYTRTTTRRMTAVVAMVDYGRNHELAG